MVNVSGATLTGLTITPEHPSVALDDQQAFKATGTFSDATMQTVTEFVTWSSSNIGTAVISPLGVAIPIGSGTSTITAQIGSISNTTVMKVP